jgi:DNA-binding response OmpR family regulator
MNEKVLLIEDEEKLARFIELELQYEGYLVEKAFDGRSGLDLAVGREFDVVILDIMLPELNGMEVLRRMRRQTSVPVILLTARDTVMDKVTGLDSGADDYMTKPFEIEELLARIRNVLRKSVRSPADNDREVTEAARQEKVLLAGKLILSADRHTVTFEGRNIDLTKKEFDLLQILLENKGFVMSREALLNKVWGYDFAGDTNVVDVYISYLRGKIDQIYAVEIISTVRGVGHMIKDE